MIARSLRLRLLAVAAVAIMGALVLAGIGMNLLFARHIEQRESLELQTKSKELLAGLRLDTANKPVVDNYPADDAFGRPASGLYWQVSTPEGRVHSPSLWDQSLSVPKQAKSDEWSRRRAAGPYGHGLLIIARMVRPDDSGQAVLVQLAIDDDNLRASQKEFGKEMTASLAILWAVLMLAAYLQVQLGLRPLSPIRDELERLRRNPAARLPLDHPREVQPLADAINALADARMNDLARARKRAADLAHSLKTPLAALSAQSRRAREAGAVDAADGLDRAISTAAAALEAELARSRSAAARDQNMEVCTVALKAVEDVISVIERTDAGEKIIFDIHVPEGLEVPVSSSDLMEILGALLENAARYAKRTVCVTGSEEAGAVTLSIEDDGPGIAEGRAEAALQRGARLDEVGAGHGFGLSIVNDLVDATDGTIRLQSSELGGLGVILRWTSTGDASSQNK